MQVVRLEDACEAPLRNQLEQDEAAERGLAARARGGGPPGLRATRVRGAWLVHAAFGGQRRAIPQRGLERLELAHQPQLMEVVLGLALELLALGAQLLQPTTARRG